MEQLKQYLVLCETLHFRSASERANTSPSTLSRSLQRLEEETGCRLLERDNRRVSLTAQGLLFRDWATEVLDGYKQLHYRMLAGRQHLQGELAIFGSVTAYYSLISPLIAAFRSRHPLVHLKLQTGSPADARRRIEQNDVDIAITMEQDEARAEISFLPLVTTPLVFIVAENCTGGQDAVDWRSLPLVLPARGPGRQRVDSWCRRNRHRPEIYAQVEGNEAIIAMVALGCGMGVVPGLVLENSPLRDRIRVLEINPTLPPYIVGLLYQKKRLLNPMVKAFRDMAASS